MIFKGDFKLAERNSGTVKWFKSKKGYGFINRENGEDVFVHYSALNIEDHRVLNEGQKVKFEVVEGRKGFETNNVNVIN